MTRWASLIKNMVVLRGVRRRLFVMRHPPKPIFGSALIPLAGGELFGYSEFQRPLDTETSLEGINIYASYHGNYIVSQHWSNLGKPRTSIEIRMTTSLSAAVLRSFDALGLMGCCILIVSSHSALQHSLEVVVAPKPTRVQLLPLRNRINIVRVIPMFITWLRILLYRTEVP